MKHIVLTGLLVFFMIGLTACVDKEIKQESDTQVTESFSQMQVDTSEESSNGEHDIQGTEKQNEEKILIAYFSLADIVPEGADAVTHATPSVGNTESAAFEIQKQTGGDLFAIKTEKSYPISHSECSKVAEEEMKTDARPELSDHIENMDQYSKMYIGYPKMEYSL